MDAIESAPEESGNAEAGSTFDLPEAELHEIAALVPDNPYATESEYGRRDCLNESERFRGKFDELFPRDCRPQTGGSGNSSGARQFSSFSTLASQNSDTSLTHPNEHDHDNTENSTDGGGSDLPGAPPPLPKPPEDADCSCSVPDFLGSVHFQTVGTQASELLRGSSIDGGPGNDTLQGGDGADVFLGGDGDDILEPGYGNDSVSGGAGNDTVNGGPDNDVVLGGNGDDIVNGGPGDDTVCGEAGRDTVSGGAGNDCASGGDGDDTVNGGTGNDSIHGNAGNDFLVGHDGDDWIEGGSGNDTLRGDAGDDTLTGGTGDDLFYFGKITGHDEVRDFTRDADHLDMRGMGLTSWALVQSHLSDTSEGVVIALNENSVLLRGVHAVVSSDFVF